MEVRVRRMRSRRRSRVGQTTDVAYIQVLGLQPPLPPLLLMIAGRGGCGTHVVFTSTVVNILGTSR